MITCGYCGNDDRRSLWLEGEVVYCSNCCRRTFIDSGEEYLVRCQHCGEMRDGAAYYCRCCGTGGF